MGLLHGLLQLKVGWCDQLSLTIRALSCVVLLSLGTVDDADVKQRQR
jgi:hypothetical protein